MAVLHNDQNILWSMASEKIKCCFVWSGHFWRGYGYYEHIVLIYVLANGFFILVHSSGSVWLPECLFISRWRQDIFYVMKTNSPVFILMLSNKLYSTLVYQIVTCQYFQLQWLLFFVCFCNIHTPSRIVSSI